MSTLSQDVRYALRILARNPRFTTAAIVTLALGIGANTTMFGIVDRLFFRAPAHVQDPGRVVRVYVTQDIAPFGRSTGSIATFPKYVDLREHVRGLDNLATFASREMSVGRGADVYQVTAGVVTASFFSLLGVQPALGRFFTEEEDRGGARLAVVGLEFARRQFGEESSVLGRTLPLGKGVYTVIGITPRGFTGVGLESTDVWLPMGAAAPDLGFPLDCKGCYWLTTVGRLRPSVTAAQVASEATAVFRHGSAAEPRDSGAIVSFGPIQEALGPTASDNAKLSLWLGGVSLIVLLIACANVANLLIARAVQRQREIAVRLAQGAGRTRLVRQLLTEGVVLAMLGAAAALLVSLWTEPVLALYLLPRGAATSVLDGRAFVFTGAVAVLTGVLATLVPAVQASRPDLTSALKVGSREGASRRSAVRAALVVVQVALTLVLLVGAGLFIRSLRNVGAIPLGFDPEHLISASVDLQQLGYKRPDINALYEQMLQRVLRLPGVANASLAIGSPFATSLAVGLEVPGVDDSLLVNRAGAAYVQFISPDYFAALGTKIRRGRGFTLTDGPGSPRVAVVNETMSHRLWPSEDPLGKCLKIGVPKIVPCSQIVGVVEDVRRNSVTEPPTMQYYVPLAQRDTGFFLPVTALLIRTVGSSSAMLIAVRREIQAVSPDLPYADIRPMKELFEWQVQPWQLGSLLFVVFGALALVLAAVGLYGVLAYTVTQRTQEIGIRIALGAVPRDVLALVVRQGLVVTAIGVGLGAVGALLSGRVIASLLYGVSPTDVAVLGMAAGVLFAVAYVASYIPARRATDVDPLTALRYE